MSNKNFEDKVLKALGNIEKDVSGLKEDVSGLKKDISRLDTKIDTVESNLNKKIDKLDVKIDGVESNLNKKIDGVEYRLNNKIDEQTGDLKRTMGLHVNYLDQTFENISRIDKERFMEQNKNVFG